MYDKEINKIYKKIGQRIVEQRKKRGISQEKLATESGIDRSHMGYIEQNRRRPTISTLYRISHTPGLNLSDLLKDL